MANMKAEKGALLFICVCVLIFVTREITTNISFKPCNCFGSFSQRLLKAVQNPSLQNTVVKDSEIDKRVSTSNKNDHIVENAKFMSKKQLKTPLLTKMKCTQKYRLLVMVTTRPDGFERRSHIRSTWARTWHQRTDLPSWKTVFQLGQSEEATVNKQALEEAEKNQDMIFGNFTDSFYKLPVKVIMAFEWATKFCDFDYLLKTDDDVFVNIPNIFKFLFLPEIPRLRLFAGNVHFQTYPIRSPGSKYYVNVQEYPYRKYPRFCSGGGMVFSQDVAAGMVAIHNNSNYFKLDDVYIGILALRLGVDAHHDHAFQSFEGAANCKCEKWTIIRHGAENKDCMDKLYNCFPHLHRDYVGFVEKEQ